MRLTRINVVLDQNELQVLTVAINNYINHNGTYHADPKEVDVIFNKMMQNSYSREKNLDTPFGNV